MLFCASAFASGLIARALNRADRPQPWRTCWRAGFCMRIGWMVCLRPASGKRSVVAHRAAAWPALGCRIRRPVRVMGSWQRHDVKNTAGGVLLSCPKGRDCGVRALLVFG